VSTIAGIVYIIARCDSRLFLLSTFVDHQ